jgi:hypothetical protein
MHPTQKKLTLAGLIPGIMLLQVRGFLENQQQGAGQFSQNTTPENWPLDVPNNQNWPVVRKIKTLRTQNQAVL